MVGYAFIYYGKAIPPTTIPDWENEQNSPDSFYGRWVSTAGDVNGDGFADVIVSASYFDGGEENEGRVYVFHGSDQGLNSTPDWQAEIDHEGAFFGTCVESAGDVNGDGYDEVIVGAPSFANGENNEGAAFLWYGSASGLGDNGTLANADWSVEANISLEQMGYRVGRAGDVNGDGYSDVVVGTISQAIVDSVRVFHGSETGLAATPDWKMNAEQYGSYFGSAVATAGDVNGDGYSDLVIGAEAQTISSSHEGKVFVFHGSFSGLGKTPAWVKQGDQEDGRFGRVVATAGDVNGDGYSDVIVGTHYYDNPLLNEGVAFVFHGSPEGLEPDPAWMVDGDQKTSFFGWDVRTAGDVNGDGFADVVVGARNYKNGEYGEGRAYLFIGSPGGLKATPAWTVESNQEYAELGTSAATAGDVNGDGFSDIIVGASYYSNGQSGEGLALLYYGNGGDGVCLHPRQEKTDSTGRISYQGMSNNKHSFRMYTMYKTPFGRSKMKMQWETKTLREVFNSQGIHTSFDWIDTGVSGVEFDRIIPGLSPSSCCHWRYRLLYHPSITVYMQHSCWITIPWRGWNETMLRLAPPVTSAIILH